VQGQSRTSYAFRGFHLFGKILLDKLAQVIEHYFGQARKASLASHSKLERNIDSYTAQRGLPPVPPKLRESASELGRGLADFRDYYVVHEASPNVVKGTGFDSEGRTWLMPVRLYPKGPDADLTCPSRILLRRS
jgi:hypothetical protein